MADNIATDSDICFNVAVVLPAAGSGVRMNLSVPKQFCTVLTKPLMSYTLDAFERVAWINEIVVAVNEKHMDITKQILKEFSHTRVKLVSGGLTRHRSIWKGIQSLTEDGRTQPDVVILHDVVRPFVDAEMLKRVTLAAKEHGAAGSIRPLVSTVIAQCEDGFLDHSLDRSKYKASEMPQAFLYEVIHNAYKKCTDNDFEHGTECLQLAQKYSNVRALLIDGPECLWKVTYQKDLYAVEGVLRDKQSHAVVLSGDKSQDFSDKLHEELGKRPVNVACFSNVQQPFSQEVADSLAAEIKKKLPSCCNTCLSLVNIVDNTGSSNQATEVSRNALIKGCTDVKSFLPMLFHTLKGCIGRGVVVQVTMSNDVKDFTSVKEGTKNIESLAKELGISCFGIFVCPDTDGKSQDKHAISGHLNKATELTICAIMDVPAVLSGQVFDTIT